MSALAAWAASALAATRALLEQFPESPERTEISDMLEQVADRVGELLELEGEA